MFKKYIVVDRNGYKLFRPGSKSYQEMRLKAGEIKKIDKNSYSRRITNWLFNPIKIQRYYYQDGTFEDRLIGNLIIFYGAIKNEIMDVVENFILTEKMLKQRYVRDLYPGAFTECPRTALQHLRSHIWGQAMRYCEIEKFQDCSHRQIKKSLDVFKPDKTIKATRINRPKIEPPKQLEKKVLENIDFTNPDLYDT